MVFWACVLGAQKKSFYGEWEEIEETRGDGSRCLSLMAARLPIATFIDGFNTVFHLGLLRGNLNPLWLPFNFAFGCFLKEENGTALGRTITLFSRET